LGIGWLIDLFLMPSLDRSAELRYDSGPVDHNLAWILLTFVGVFGIHRIYMGKYLTGLIYFLTVGLAGIGILYDYWTLNEQVSEANAERQ
ncbi:MAG: TM2 domain-containing protein, partial [Polyangiales bacterium]